MLTACMMEALICAVSCTMHHHEGISSDLLLMRGKGWRYYCYLWLTLFRRCVRRFKKQISMESLLISMQSSKAQLVSSWYMLQSFWKKWLGSSEGRSLFWLCQWALGKGRVDNTVDTWVDLILLCISITWCYLIFSSDPKLGLHAQMVQTINCQAHFYCLYKLRWMHYFPTVQNTGEQGMFSHCLFLFLSSHILSEKKTFYGKTTEGKHSND